MLARPFERSDRTCGASVVLACMTGSLGNNFRRSPRGRPILALALLSSVTHAWADNVSFSEDVLPVLESKCVVCHQGATAQKGLRVGSVDELLRGGETGPAIEPGGPDSSLLVAMAGGEKPAMPPVGDPLSPAELNLIRAWIAAGAVDDSGDRPTAEAAVWWSLRPLRAAPTPPPPGDWERSGIDGFLLAAMREKSLTPSEEADRRTLVRRLSFDLLGLPPSLEASEAFVQDPDPAAYERLVDRLLSSPAYGERWGRHWLDVVRFGESNGYEQNHLRVSAWPYRDWVIQAFNGDKPFDRMIVEQIAADQVAPRRPTGACGDRLPCRRTARHGGDQESRRRSAEAGQSLG